MTQTQTTSHLLTEVEVRSVERLSPCFQRLELGAAELADFGVAGPLLDQRIKLLLPGPGGLPALAEGGEDWYDVWLSLPEGDRGHLRTYSIRDVRGSGADTRLVLDVVLHGDDPGPGSLWAATATVGDRAIVLAPRRGVPFGGIEFDPPASGSLLLVGDESAVPAVGRILDDLPATATGAVFLEVPDAADILDLRAPVGVEITWLARGNRPVGELLDAAVRNHLGTAPGTDDVPEDEVDADLWETPTFSSSGEELADAARPVGSDLADLYAWIAGESRWVTGLRRHLVRDLGVHRSQVAFMGYWREGVAMRC